MSTLTDSTKTPKVGTGHTHGLSKVDAQFAALPAAKLTEADVLAIKAMAAAQGGGGSPTPVPAPTPTPSDPPPPSTPPGAPAAPTPDGGLIVTVSSILALKQKIADDTVSKVTLQGGDYACANPAALQANSLWIGTDRGSNGADMTHRTHTVIVDTSAARFLGAGMKVMEGAKFIDWNGPKFRSQSISLEGIFKVGGDAGYAPPHDLVFRGIDIDSSCVGLDSGAQAIYFAHALGRGPYNIDIVSPRLDLGGGLYAAIQGYHSAAGAPCADNIRVWDAQAVNAQIGVIVWDPTVHDWYVELVHTATSKYGLSYNWNLHGGEQAPTGGPPTNMDIRNHVTAVSPRGTYLGNYIPSATGLV